MDSPPDDVPPLPDYAAELEAELAFGRDLPYSPEEGTRHMRARIAGLEAELNTAPAGAALDAWRQATAARLAEARSRLVEYELQFKSNN